jgi:selenocysteine lyase/cysteine desulfurase
VFGIQSRAGCLCAGPYAQTLLGIDAHKVAHFLVITPALFTLIDFGCYAKLQALGFVECLLDKNEVMRPGFTRVNFNYFITQTECDYIINAVIWTAEYGRASLLMPI